MLPLVSLLVLMTTILAWRAVTRDRRDMARFRTLRSTALRRKTFARWIVESFIVLGGLSGLILLAVWPDVPRALHAGRALFAFLDDGSAAGIVIGSAVTISLILVASVFLLRGRIDEIPTVGNIQALLPRNRGELPYGAGLAITAGIVEELLFRVALPALVFAITGNALTAFVGGVVLFGLLHLYQGPAGMIAATALGVFFTAFYLLSSSFVLVAALHALFDLRSLVLIPVVLGTAGRRTAVQLGESST